MRDESLGEFLRMVQERAVLFAMFQTRAQSCTLDLYSVEDYRGKSVPCFCDVWTWRVNPVERSVELCAK